MVFNLCVSFPNFRNETGYNENLFMTNFFGNLSISLYPGLTVYGPVESLFPHDVTWTADVMNYAEKTGHTRKE